MGKHYEDNFEREAEYQRWFCYRESSYEERESKRQSAYPHEKLSGDKPATENQYVEWSVINVFRDFPEHQKMIAETELQYLESQLKKTSLDDEGNSN